MSEQRALWGSKLGFILAAVGSLLSGLILISLFRSEKEIEGIKEGFAVVSLGWVTLAFWGAVPFFAYFLSGLPSGSFTLIFTII